MSRILIVDEQPVTRHALRLMMEADRHEVVGEADNGPDALFQVRQCKPDLMILELSIPRLGGLEVLQRLVAQESPVKVLVLTSQDSEYFAGRCLTAGAAGFVSKQENPDAVREAVRAIAQGHSYFPSHALGSVSAAEEAGHGELLKGLSVRELSVLQLLARGLSNIAIADQLSISDKTVSTYKVRLMQKLHAKSLVELVDIGRRHGLVEGGASAPADTQPALDEAQASELALLRKVIDSLPHPMTVRALDGSILFCNQKTLELIGLREDEVVGKTLAGLGLFANSHEAALLGERLRELISRGDPYEVDVEFGSLQGRRVYQHWGRPYHGSDNRLIGAICGSIDMTGRDDLVRELRSVNARIEAISLGKSQFLAGMGSELQGPLQNIQAMIDLALNQPDPARRQEPLAVARNLAGNLLTVLEDLQTLSRAKSRRLQLEPEETDLRALIERQVQKIAEPASTKGLRLEMDFDLALQTRVWCDPLRMRQILDNLLKNALKHTDVGSILVRLRARGRGEGMVEVEIDVADTGVGISLDDQLHLFDPFSIPIDDLRIRSGGTGLGLAMCRALAELMGGEIRADSSLGVGSTFSLALQLPGASL